MSKTMPFKTEPFEAEVTGIPKGANRLGNDLLIVDNSRRMCDCINKLGHGGLSGVMVH